MFRKLLDEHPILLRETCLSSNCPIYTQNRTSVVPVSVFQSDRGREDTKPFDGQERHGQGWVWWMAGVLIKVLWVLKQSQDPVDEAVKASEEE